VAMISPEKTIESGQGTQGNHGSRRLVSDGNGMNSLIYGDDGCR
jgi:hypothetical protein